MIYLPASEMVDPSFWAVVFDVFTMLVADVFNDVEAAVSLVSDADGDFRILFALNGGIGSM